MRERLELQEQEREEEEKQLRTQLLAARVVSQHMKKQAVQVEINRRAQQMVEEERKNMKENVKRLLM